MRPSGRLRGPDGSRERVDLVLAASTRTLDSRQQPRDKRGTSTAAANGLKRVTPTKQCDLVMKGGITSGVVYPSAIKRVSQDYILRNIGGASAGAIAAVVAAACEYRRREGQPGAFDGLDAVIKQLGEAGFVQGLFQPSLKAKPAFDVALAYATSTKGTVGRIMTLAGMTLRRAPQLLLSASLGVLLWLLFLAFTSWSLARGAFSWVETVAIASFAIVGFIGIAAVIAAAVVIALVRFAIAANSALENNRLGMCSGRTVLPSQIPGLTDWLHTTIQTLAGLPADKPLTFEDLAGSDATRAISLRLVTTDLSYARPVDLPLSEAQASTTKESHGLTITGETIYYFDPQELAHLFPEAVVNAMKAAAGKPATLAGAPEGKTFYRMPGPKLPILVAARLSLSFPMLLSTVPLWSQHPSLDYPVEHCMSDGGICSNFPISFFDSLFPNRPTFGLDLEPYPDRKMQQALKNEPYVIFGDQRRLPGFSSIEGIATFFRQLLDAARNWRDNLQSELPGYRDRICQIRLTHEEGGLNLNMPAPIIARLVARGIQAGDTICGPTFDWNQHRFTRYLTLMQALQSGFKPVPAAFDTFTSEMPNISPTWPTYKGHEGNWWDKESKQTQAFFDGVPWGKGATDFEQHAPVLEAELRITPGT